MKEIDLYTDGACEPNPGHGGWACILIYKESKKELSGYSELSTNNIMELRAVIEGLKVLKEPCKVNIYSDSAYVVNAFKNKWIDNWIKNNWKTSSGDNVANKEEWIELIKLLRIHNVNFNKVKGHSNNIYNERCDRLAVNEIKKRRK